MNLYEINDKLTELVNPETGEISDFEAFANLQMALEEKKEGIALWYKNLTAEYEAIKTEANALNKRAEIVRNKADRLKEYLSTFLDGEKFETPRVTVKFTKSKALEVDDEFIDWAEEHNPDLLRYKTPEVDKTAVKDLIKQGEAFEHARLVERQNIQIK